MNVLSFQEVDHTSSDFNIENIFPLNFLIFIILLNRFCIYIMAEFNLEEHAQKLADFHGQSIVAENEAKNYLDNCLRIKSSRSKELSDKVKESAELGRQIEELTIKKKAADAKVEENTALLEGMAVDTAAATINYGLACSVTKTAEDNISKLLKILSPRKTFSLFFN